MDELLIKIIGTVEIPVVGVFIKSHDMSNTQLDVYHGLHGFVIVPGLYLCVVTCRGEVYNLCVTCFQPKKKRCQVIACSRKF